MKCPYSRSVICCKSWLSYLTVKSAVCIYGIIPKTLKIDLNKINNWRCPNRHSWVATGFLRAYIFVDVVTVLVNDDTVSWVLSLIDCKESSLYWRIKGYVIRSKIYKPLLRYAVCCASKRRRCLILDRGTGDRVGSWKCRPSTNGF